MNSSIRVLLYSFLMSTAIIASDERPAIPAGVRYKFMDDKQEAEFREQLVLKFKDGPSKVQSLFKDTCICAPGYWLSLKTSLAGKIKNPTTSTFIVPNTQTGKSSELEGATFRDQKDLKLLSEQLAKDVGTKPIVRKGWGWGQSNYYNHTERACGWQRETMMGPPRIEFAGTIDHVMDRERSFPPTLAARRARPLNSLSRNHAIEMGGAALVPRVAPKSGQEC
jgi:hypothetical protein